MTASIEVKDGIAVITVDNPPVNSMSHAARSGIADGMEQALADASVKAIVLTGRGKSFCAGAEIKEFNTPAAFAEPTLGTVIDLIENSPKPVVAAINGTAMGGGLELALGCHYRVAVRGAQIALPEVKLGILPGAGGTQRLPRVIGVEHALNMIVSGTAVPSRHAGADRAVQPHGRLARGRRGSGRSRSRTRSPTSCRRRRSATSSIDFPLHEAFFAFARNTVGAVAKNYPAPKKCVDAVEAAVTKRFDDGIAFERACFLELVQTPESKALRHAFFGERAASQDPRRAGRHADAPDQVGRRDRRRHDGRRHRDELRERRHSGQGARTEAGSARPRPRHRPQELREHAEEGQADAGQVRPARRPDQRHDELRRHQGRRHRRSRRCSRRWASRKRCSRSSTR